MDELEQSTEGELETAIVVRSDGREIRIYRASEQAEINIDEVVAIVDGGGLIFPLLDRQWLKYDIVYLHHEDFDDLVANTEEMHLH